MRQKKIIFVFSLFLFLCSPREGQAADTKDILRPSSMQAVKTSNEKSLDDRTAEGIKPEENIIDTKAILEKLDNLSIQNARIMEMLQQVERKVRNIENKVGRQ
ncbi:MAG: hypothetical protein WCQ99_03265 [Pseudomonadota bacterium]